MVRCVICGIRTPCLNVSFHSFPLKNRKLCEKWSALVPRKNYPVTQYAKVCSRHFTEDSYMKGYVSKKILADGALPTLNLPEVQNEVENTPVNIPQDHAYCRDKSSEKLPEKPAENCTEKFGKEKPLENLVKRSPEKFKKSIEKVVQTPLGKSTEFSNKNNMPVLKENIIKTNHGILIDTSKYQVIELPDNFKVDHLLTDSTAIHYKNIRYQNPPYSNSDIDKDNNNSNININNNIINKKIVKLKSKPPNIIQPTKFHTPWHSDHIYNKSLEMIEKQESILQRKERSIKKLRLKLINSQKKSRRQALKIKELKNKIMELMVQNANKVSCSDCVGKHYLP